ncbi:hypothetical protein BC828DRAFT_239680 [Blastocladiella britannica]|nr:hypothetical protein BC828DRAFT_239680 [Blastocladiella britannica]
MYNLKAHGPGGPQSTGALVPKVLAFAFASRRLAWAKSTDCESLPYPTLAPLWRRLRAMPTLQGSMPEIFTQAKIYGLQVDLDEMDKDHFALLVTGTVPLEFGAHPTPNIMVVVESGPVSFHYESILFQIDYLAERVHYSTYLPTFMDSWDKNTATISLRRFTTIDHGLGLEMPEMVPMGDKTPLSKASIKLVQEVACSAVVEGISRATAQVLENRRHQKALLAIDRIFEQKARAGQGRARRACSGGGRPADARGGAVPGAAQERQDLAQGARRRADCDQDPDPGAAVDWDRIAAVVRAHARPAARTAFRRRKARVSNRANV